MVPTSQEPQTTVQKTNSPNLTDTTTARAPFESLEDLLSDRWLATHPSHRSGRSPRCVSRNGRPDPLAHDLKRLPLYRIPLPAIIPPERSLPCAYLVPRNSPEFYVFAENVAFSSPTAGAVIVNAGNFSGRTGSWRVEGTSKTYQDWHAEKLAKAGAAPADVE
jgi:hypothetical protein